MPAFEIQVTIDLPGIPEAIRGFSGALHDIADAMRGSNNTVTPMAVTTPATVIAPAPEPAPAAPTPEPAPAVAPAAPEAPVQEATPEPKATPAPAKEYTFKQISTAGAKLCSDQTKMNQLIDLLNSKYGAPAITMIDKSRFPELAEDLIKLGAEIEEE